MVNFALTVVIGQSFLSMLCTMRAGVFFFFAGECGERARHARALAQVAARRRAPHTARTHCLLRTRTAPNHLLAWLLVSMPCTPHTTHSLAGVHGAVHVAPGA
jgi:hypothetical protein